jgi:hypothetical protein
MARRGVNESQWRHDVTTLATGAGWAWYYTAYSLYSTPGWPDLALVKPPRVVLAELKGPRGKVRAGQEVTADLLQRCERVDYRLWRPDDLDDVLADLGVNVRQARLL